jgi:hypothetical protein
MYFVFVHSDDAFRFFWGAETYTVGPWVDERLEFGGVYAYRWVFYWTVYQSMAHFYFDSFMWKMRMPIVRESI